MLQEPGKIVSPAEAAQIIKTGDTVAFDGFIGIGFAEELAAALEERYLNTGEPSGLTFFYASGLGDGEAKGLNRLAHEGLIKRLVCGHYGLTPGLVKLAVENKIEAYNLPQGVISCMFRDIAAKRPRTITSVGLGTFVDPRRGGGKINELTVEDLVEVIEFDGKEYLSYKPLHIDVAVLRGTTADLEGNISMEKEALTLDGLPIAMAAKNCGGTVLVQVERTADRDALPVNRVKIPKVLVDCVVVARPENHTQTYATSYNPAYAGEFRVPLETSGSYSLDEKKIMSRRAALELRQNQVVNLGFGAPEGIAGVAAEEGILDLIPLTAEPGVMGGMPAGGLDFGAARNVDAIVDQGYQFDYYDGGGLDAAFLGLAQVDERGNLNVSRFGPRLAGAGGFINISQNAGKVVFLGAFTAGGLQLEVKNGKLEIAREGKYKKFVKQVEQVTFSGEVAIQNRKPVLFITERCVFRLGRQGLELAEIAPGVDLEKDILAHMEFEPVIKETPPAMDLRIFENQPMGLKKELTDIPIRERLTYDHNRNTLFVNFESLSIRSLQEIEEIKQEVEKKLSGLDHRVYAVVNYHNFDIVPELVDAYVEMVHYLTERYYQKVTRYSTGAFQKLKLDTLL